MKTYVVKNNSYTTTGVELIVDSCQEITAPFTFLKQPNCSTSKVSLENSKKVLTKGILKQWLKQCIDDKLLY